MLLKLCLLHYHVHVHVRLGHFGLNLIVLFGEEFVQVVGHLRVYHGDILLISDLKHIAELILQGCYLVHLRHLSLFSLIVFKGLLALLEYVFTHDHGLLERLLPVRHDLLQRLLIHLNHLRLVLEHATGLLLLLVHPV